MQQEKPAENEVVVVSTEKLRQIVFEEVRRALSAEEPETESEYLTQAQAAKLLQVSAPTLRRWGAEGKLKDVVKIGRTVRYSRAELLRLQNSSSEQD